MCKAGVIGLGVGSVSIEGEYKWLDKVVLVTRLAGHLLGFEEARDAADPADVDVGEAG